MKLTKAQTNALLASQDHNGAIVVRNSAAISGTVSRRTAEALEKRGFVAQSADADFYYVTKEGEAIIQTL